MVKKFLKVRHNILISSKGVKIKFINKPNSDIKTILNDTKSLDSQLLYISEDNKI